MAQQGGGGSNGWTHTDSLIAGVIGGIVGASVLFWLAGQIGAVLTGHGWPHTGVRDIITIVFGVVTHPFHPAQAWPADVRHQIPPAIIYYPILIIMTVGGIFFGTRAYDWIRDGDSGEGFFRRG